jgi:hypothetical protein
MTTTTEQSSSGSSIFFSKIDSISRIEEGPSPYEASEAKKKAKMAIDKIRRISIQMDAARRNESLKKLVTSSTNISLENGTQLDFTPNDKLSSFYKISKAINTTHEEVEEQNSIQEDSPK